tara:strand:+ start:136690 stop:137424 length:735 start_codon:yes stop_codon:yes gene_type:complete
MSKAILITGATRGLGANLARHFATRGYRLALTGRKQSDLDALEAQLAPSAAQIVTAVLDVAEVDTIEPTLRQCAQALGGLDIVVANAGIAQAARAGTGQFQSMQDTIAVNITGAMATADVAVALFREQGHGQLVGITSVAAVRGLPGQGAYSASKAALGIFLDAVRCETRNENIVITELAPGFIDTELNRSMPNRPFVVSAERGTRVMADLIEKQLSFRYVPPWPWTLVAQCMKWLPDSIIAKM